MCKRLIGTYQPLVFVYSFKKVTKTKLTCFTKLLFIFLSMMSTRLLVRNSCIGYIQYVHWKYFDNLRTKKKYLSDDKTEVLYRRQHIKLPQTNNYFNGFSTLMEYSKGWNCYLKNGVHWSASVARRVQLNSFI